MDRTTLKFKADEQRLIGGQALFASDTINYIEAEFELGENWSGYDSVRAVWHTNHDSISTVLNEAGHCVVPQEVLRREGKVEVNLVGSIASGNVLTDRLTTYPIVAIVVDAKAKIHSTETSPITPNQFEQFASIIHDDAVSAASSASDAATSASEAAASATRASNSAADATRRANQAYNYANAAERAKTAAESARDSAQSYRDGALNAVQAASQAAGTAQTASSNANIYASRASESATNASQSASQAESAKNTILNMKEDFEELYYKKTLSGTNGYYGYFPVEIIIGDVYEITNNTSGTGVVESVNDNNQRVETFIPNINPHETVSFTPTLEASKLRIWFNATGTYTLINTNKIIPELQKKVDDIETDLSALETTVSDNATATEIITTTGKNLLNPNDLTITGQYYDTGSGHTSDANYKSYATPIEVEPSTPYVFSVNGRTNVVFVTKVELNENMTKVVGGYNQSGTFTTQATTKYLLLSIDAGYANQQPQLENGTSATPYTPYVEPQKSTEVRVDLNQLSNKIIPELQKKVDDIETDLSALETTVSDNATATEIITTEVRVDLNQLSNFANPLKGKKICSFGDSLAAGDNGDRTANTWIKIVSNYFGAEPYNRGIGSSCVTDETSAGVARTGYAYVNSDGDAGKIRGLYSTAQSFANYPNSISPWMCDSDRANTIPTDTSVVIIMAGTNDIGTVTIDGFKTAYRTMLNNIIARVPNAKIYPCTMPFQQTYDMGTDADKAAYNSYRTAIKDISAEYGFECIDLRSKMGVNAQNYSTYMSDATHYATNAGKKKMAECVISHIKTATFL